MNSQALVMLRLGLLSLVLVVCVVAVAIPALGWASLGCKWDPGLFPTIGYQFNAVSSTNQTAFNTARGWWDSETTPDTDLVSASGDVQIEIYDLNDVTDGRTAWWGYGCSSGYFSSHEGAMRFNDAHMPSGPYPKAVVAAHEIGHTYGLADTSMNCFYTPRVMEQGSEKWSTNGNCDPNPPWSDDLAGWEDLNT